MFADDRDCEHFSRLVGEYKARCGARVYHWAWMGNHYHMLVEVAHENLRRFAGGIQQKYARYHHGRHGTRGVFWQGRFGSKPVEVGDYLAVCGRYIERNPVRAGLVKQAWEYRWSSARHYVRGEEDGLTDTNVFLGRMTVQDRRRYEGMLARGEDEALMQAAKQKRVIGRGDYAQRLSKRQGREGWKRGRPVRATSPARVPISR